MHFSNIEDSLLVPSSISIDFSTQGVYTLHYLDKLFNYFKANFRLIIPFLYQYSTNNPDDPFNKLIPKSLLTSPVSQWLTVLKTFTTSLVSHYCQPANELNGIRNACQILCELLVLFENIATNSIFQTLLPSAQILFETHSLCVLISTQTILVPKCPKSLKTVVEGLEIEATPFEKERAHMSEYLDEDVGAGDDARLSFCPHLMEFGDSVISIKSRSSRCTFLSTLVDLVLAEAGIDSKMLAVSRRSDWTPLEKQPIGILSLSTLKYIISSLPFPGLAPMAPNLDIVHHPTTPTVQLVASWPQPSGLLPIKMAQAVSAVHQMVQLLTQHAEQTPVWASVTFTLTQTFQKLQLQWQKDVAQYGAAIEELKDEKGEPCCPEVVRDYGQKVIALFKDLFFQFKDRIESEKSRQDRDKMKRLSLPIFTNEDASRSTASTASVEPLTALQNSPSKLGINLPGKRSKQAASRAGQRVNHHKVKTCREQIRQIDSQENRRIDQLICFSSLPSSAILDEMPPGLQDAFTTVLGIKIFAVGRFPQIPKLSSVSLSVFLKGSAIDLQQADDGESAMGLTRFLHFILAAAEIILISSHLAEEFHDILLLENAKAGPSVPSVDRRTLYQTLYKALPATKCRSGHWLLTLVRARNFFPHLLTGGPQDWLLDLPPYHGLNSATHRSICLQPKDCPTKVVLPSRTLFLLSSPSCCTAHCHTPPDKQALTAEQFAIPKANTPSHHLFTRKSDHESAPEGGVTQLAEVAAAGGFEVEDLALALVGQMEPAVQSESCTEPLELAGNEVLGFCTREMLSCLVRSPSNNILISGQMASSFLRPLLDRLTSSGGTKRSVRVILVLPRGVVVDMDPVIVEEEVADLVRAAVSADLGPLDLLQTEYGSDLLSIDVVSYQWAEDCLILNDGFPLDHRPYIVSHMGDLGPFRLLGCKRKCSHNDDTSRELKARKVQ